METRIITLQDLDDFRKNLIREEKSTATVEKYMRDVRAFSNYTGKKELTKEMVIGYKKRLEETNYAVRSINSMLASVNSFLVFMNWSDYKVKSIRVQRQIYQAKEKELTKSEYMRLLKAAEDKPEMQLIMQTICGTGIRVSELKYFTVDAIKKGEVNVHCKGKIREILIPGKLRQLLMKHIKKRGLKEGSIFLGRNGSPLNRSVIWAKMKKLCEKDVAKLADILVHGSIETTRIYIMGTGAEHRQKIERLGLII